MNWLANANLAATMTFGVKGINPDGSMTWETALNWVAALNKAHYLGHTDWILPPTPPTDPHATLHNKTTGLDYGFDFYSSDMGELFYKEFGATKGESISLIHNQNTNDFENLQPYYYWSGTTRSLPADFSFGNGFLGTDVDIDFEYAIPEFPSVPSAPPPTPPPNNIVPLHPPTVKPTLSLNPDGQTIHDAALNINWLANANLAATQTFGVKSIHADGSMTYKTAVAWIAAMNAADYLGHDNWRLPDSQGSHLQGYYETAAEMGELYYTELGGQAGSTILLTHDSDEELFRNFQPYLYWSGTNVGVKTDSHKTFSFGNGYRSDNVDPNLMYVLPVFDGKAWGPVQGDIKKPVLSTSPQALAVLAVTITNGPFTNEAATGPVVMAVNLGAVSVPGLQADSRNVTGTLRVGHFAPHHAVGGQSGSELIGDNNGDRFSAFEEAILGDLQR
jgi:hypothetical protein